MCYPGPFKFVQEGWNPGDVATFDTGVAHTFGNGGDTPAELLSIFGRPSERMTLRTSQVRVTAALPGDSE